MATETLISNLYQTKVIRYVKTIVKQVTVILNPRIVMRLDIYKTRTYMVVNIHLKESLFFIFKFYFTSNSYQKNVSNTNYN